MKIRGVFKSCVFCAGLAVVLVLAFSSAADAAVRYNRIEKVMGFRFGNIMYAWNKIELDVVNITSDNKMFGATMIFLDRRGRPLARASLLPKKIAGMQAERYTAYLVEGSGEAARRAASIIWDFGTR